MAARAARAHAEDPRTPKLSIGQVLQRLASEFPELSPSKLRFLEDKGLVRPSRTEKGYRKYSDADVERIRTALEMQRDRYLPLKVIAEYLDDRDQGGEPERPGSRAPSTATMLPADAHLDRPELLRRAGASAALLEQAVQTGLLVASPRYTGDDLTMLRTLVELERVGIGPRHLRSFRAAAQHELGLIEQAVPSAARRGEPGGGHRDVERAAELADLLEIVRRTLIRQALADGGRPRSSR